MASTTIWDRLQSALKAAFSAWNDAGSNDFWSGNVGLGIEDLDAEQLERAQRIALLWRYYNGEFERPLHVSPGKPDDNILVNHCRRVVNKGVSFLFGKELQWELQEGEETEEEKALEAVWRANHKMTLLTDLGLNGAVAGTFYLQIVPNESEPEEPRVLSLSPQIVFPEWNPNDVDEVWAYQIRWQEDGRPHRTIWSLDDSMARWEAWTEVRGSRGKWEQEGERTRWDYPWSPILAGQNLPNPNEFFGLSDLEDADLNDAINFSASNINRILRLYAHPVPWGKGFGQKDLMVEPGKAILSQSDQAALQYLQMSSDLGSSLAFWQRLTTDFYKTMQVPEMDPNVMSLGAQSGFALRVLYGDLMEKTEIKRRLYGDAIVETNRRLLDLLGKGDDHLVTLHWQDPLPRDEHSEIAGLQFDAAAGASQETILRKRGYDPETEAERRKQEQADQANLGQELLKAFDRGQVGLPNGQPLRADAGE
jgi:hypothetical protein